MYKYALNHPQDVASLILVDVSRPEAELKAKQVGEPSNDCKRSKYPSSISDVIINKS